jgi:hypothetical protein
MLRHSLVHAGVTVLQNLPHGYVLCHVVLRCALSCLCWSIDTHVIQTRLKSETARQTDTLHAMQENFDQQKAVYASTIAQLQV